MTDHPILFSAAMIRALLAGTKTQTRRILPNQPRGPLKAGDHVVGMPGMYMVGDIIWPIAPSVSRVRNFPEPPDAWIEQNVKFKVGDRLWAREAWRTFASFDDVPPREILKPGRGAGVYYDADAFGLSITSEGERYYGERESQSAFGKLRPSMFMPRWASRLTLVVTGVKVERLQDISEEDAWAEGVCTWCEGLDKIPWTGLSIDDRRGLVRSTYGSAGNAYRHLWEHINGAGSWAENPWVSATSFSVHRTNIDAMKEAA